MSSFADQIVAYFRRWLVEDDLIDKLDPRSVAFLALPTDATALKHLHEQAHRCADGLPRDAWLIGEDGAGNYWFLVDSSVDTPVMFFDHEWQQVEHEFDTLRAYYENFRGLAIRQMNQPGPTPHGPP